MHAYKDAIRRTAGAYVLYPGNDKPYKPRGFHEIIPGLGAFAVSPSDNGTGLEQLESFIKDVVDHYSNRATCREGLSYHTYEINHKNRKQEYFFESAPEKYKGDRVKPPSEIFVLIGYIRDKQKDWVESKKMYNIRFDVPIDAEKVNANYLLLYDTIKGTKNTKTNKIFRIENNPVIWDKGKLIDEKYPLPGSKEYFVYEIKPLTESWTEGLAWDISKLKEYRKTATL